MRLLVFLVLFIVHFGVYGQQTMAFESEYATYKEGIALFEKQLFVSAQKQFEKVINNKAYNNKEVKSNAAYYHALCGIELFNRDADYLLREFIRNYPESPLVPQAYYQLGKYNYRKPDWKRAIQWLEEVDPYDLKAVEVAEYYFMLGYAYHMEGKSTEALKQFFEIKDTDNAFYAPANYYFSHINYEQKNYETALKGFQKIENHPKFKVIVPYYVAQIYYLQKNYDKLLNYAPQYIDSVTDKRVGEFAKIIGDAYFEKRQYNEAAVYLERFAKEASLVTKEDKYQLGYTYFKAGDCDKAIEMFNGLSRFEDEIAQASFYNMGECHLRNGNKPFARNAFYEAFTLGFDPEINKDALYKFAVLSYELNYDPYNSAIKAFTDFIETYPNAEETDDAYTYLLNLYLTSKNYDKALASIEKIKQPDIRLKGAYQLIAYNKATQLFIDENYEEANAYFEKSKRYPVDEKLNALTTFWQAEVKFAEKSFNAAANQYQQFLFSPRAILTPYFQLAHYNLGYAYYKQMDYLNASSWFRKFVVFDSNKDTVRMSDAYNRIGDCYFVSRQFGEAVNYYNQAISLKQQDADYAYYQSAIAFGILKQRDRKSEMLNELITYFPQSSFIDAAYYQLAKNYVLANNELKAADYFDKVVKDYPSSEYVKKSLINLGQINFNQRSNEKALAYFKQVVADYPTFEDTREALVGIRNIYVDNGKMEEYEAYINSLDFIDISKATLDSTTYESAEIQYSDGDYLEAIDAFSRYLKRFDPANFEVNALYYRADAYTQIGATPKALEDYEALANMPIHKFSVYAIQNAADLNYDLEKYAKAEQFYLQLLSSTNDDLITTPAKYRLLEMAHRTEEADKIFKYVGPVLALPRLATADWIKAKYFTAKALYWQNNFDSAYMVFESIADTNGGKLSAESNYYLADILYIKNQLKEAEQQVFSLVNRVPSYDYWIAKGLILLADIYVALNDLFQAKATLKSIVENYEGAELRQLAAEKLNYIEELEKPAPVEAPQAEVEIDFMENDDLDFDPSLFEPEEILEDEE